MELFKDINFDFLRWKWWALGLSGLLAVASLASFAVKGLNWGIDFRGGALMMVKWQGEPPVNRIRTVIGETVPGEVSVYEVGDFSSREVAIGTELREERQLNIDRDAMQKALEAHFGQPGSGKLEFNNGSEQDLVERLRDPLQRAGIGKSDQELRALAEALVDFRNSPPRSGLIASFDQLAQVPGVTAGVVEVLKQESYLAPYAIRQVEMVGPKVGAELRKRALLATLYALAGMLVYIAFRFEWIYGVAAVLAVAHDAFLTVGLFSILGKEISLTVIAALLTLVGYSMNDTIVIFDRVRENLRLSRRESLAQVVNRSLNQTFSRTIMTSGLTLLAVLALYFFGGPVLNAFAFALVVGFIIGVYSTVFIAGPVVLAWNERSARRQRPVAPQAPKQPDTARKGQPKVLKS